MLVAFTILSALALAPIRAAQAAPPTLAVTCTVHPSTVAAGGDVAIMATGFSAQNRHMSYSFKATSGTVSPAGASAATLHTAADSPATITVTCNVVDDHGAEASKTAVVTLVTAQKP